MSASPPTSSSPRTAGSGGACCVSPTSSRRKKCSPNRSGGSSRKSLGSRECGSSVLNSVNKPTFQFKKSMNHRSGSPIDWFPRKKTESYLKRKIKRLQETDGMTASLQDTLGNANPHYTRMAREKIAAREAARKAMVARKVAMVEASWCKILQAARIQNKEAEGLMEKAKLHATEAFEEARVIGVMMYDRPDCANQQYEVESSPYTGGRSTHKVMASFQTGFDVDMEVAAAVKKAFVRLANSPDSSNKEEFKELLWKLRQNPDAAEIDGNSEAEEKLGDINNEETNNETFRTSVFPSDFNTTDVQQSADLVDIMFERIKALHEDNLASLAVIVATSGLNAALQCDRGKYHEMKPVNHITASQSRRYSTAASFLDIQGPKATVMSELPSLDKFLVKHLSKLEREVQEARESGRKANLAKSVAQDAQAQLTRSNTKAPEFLSDLGNILVKHVSVLEKEILEAKKNNQHTEPSERICKDVEAHVVKHIQASNEKDKAQSEVLHNCDFKSCDSRGSGEESNRIQASSDCAPEDKEAKMLISHQLPPSGAKGNQGGKRLSRTEAARLEVLRTFCTKDTNALDVGLDKVFVKSAHRLEKENRKALEQEQTYMQKDPMKNCQNTTASLDQILVKHVSRLEREKMEYQKRNASHDERNYSNNATASESLDQVLVKHVSRLEREKMEYVKRNISGEGRIGVQNDHHKHSNNNNNNNNNTAFDNLDHIDHEKSDTPQFGDGVARGVDDISLKHPTKLEQSKQAAAEEKPTRIFNPVEERRRAREKELLDAWGGEGLGSSMKPHISKIESDKAAWRELEQEHKQERRRAREKELLDTWGGVGLGNSMKPHVSKIEKDKAAWRKSEEELKHICNTRQL